MLFFNRDWNPAGGAEFGSLMKGGGGSDEACLQRSEVVKSVKTKAKVTVKNQEPLLNGHPLPPSRTRAGSFLKDTEKK